MDLTNETTLMNTTTQISTVFSGSSSPSVFITNDALSPFYKQLSTAGVVPLLVIVTGIRSLIAALSILLNADLVWLTVKNRNLHGPCNILIAMESLALAINQCGTTVIFFVVLTGKNLIHLDMCFWIQALPVFCRYFVLGIMFAIGLDRIKCILLPRWPSGKYNPHYLSMLTILCMLCPFWVLYASLLVAIDQPNISVMCASSEIYQGTASDLATTSALVLNCISPAIYCILALIIYLKKIAKKELKNMRIYKSVILIFLVQLLGWGTNSLSQMFFNMFFSSANVALNDYQKWAINALFSYVQILATAANAPILYYCSTEYKAAFRRQFGCFGTIESPQQATTFNNSGLIKQGNLIRTVPINNSRLT